MDRRLITRGLGLLALGLATLAQPQHALAKAARPDPLAVPADQAGCERYVGTPVGANDATQRFELIVCPDATTPGRVTTTVQTSSLVSGWSKRSGSGTWDADGKTLRLADARMLEDRPEPGWRFCLIDEAVLERDPAGGLRGHYLSKACEDRADLQLDKLAADAPLVEAPAPGGPNGPSEPPQRSEPSPDRSEPNPDRGVEPANAPSGSEPSRGCACVLAPSDARPGLPLLAALAVLGALVRRRRRGPAAPRA